MQIIVSTVSGDAAGVTPGLGTAGRQRRLRCLPLIWGGLVLVGTTQLVLHDLTPARAGGLPQKSDAAIVKSDSTVRLTHCSILTLFVHPLCPCSRASVAELHELLDATSGLLVARIYFVVAPGLDVDPHQTELWNLAATLPNTTLLIDDGSAAQKFGALASGQAYVFDENNSLQFSGGLTSARGKIGATAASQSLRAILNGQAAVSPIVSPVFGCSLR